jgi:hypothetical protein
MNVYITSIDDLIAHFKREAETARNMGKMKGALVRERKHYQTVEVTFNAAADAAIVYRATMKAGRKGELPNTVQAVWDKENPADRQDLNQILLSLSRGLREQHGFMPAAHPDYGIPDDHKTIKGRTVQAVADLIDYVNIHPEAKSVINSLGMTWGKVVQAPARKLHKLYLADNNHDEYAGYVCVEASHVKLNETAPGELGPHGFVADGVHVYFSNTSYTLDEER